MRKIARVSDPLADVRWEIVHATNDGIYAFLRSSEYDGPATGEEWYPSLSDADSACAQKYGITGSDWLAIADPLPDCQQDWISPVRVAGRVSGAPRWGGYERLVDGEWTRIDASSFRLTIEAAIQQANAADQLSAGR